MKENKVRKRAVKVQYLFAAAVLAAVILPGFASKVELELAELSNGDSFCYRGLDWQDNKKDVEEKLGLEFDQPVMNSGYGTKIYQNEDGMKLFEMTGTEYYKFDTAGLENVEVIFSAEDGIPDLGEFEQRISSGLTELYGDPEYTLEREALYPVVSENMVKFKKSCWKAEAGEGLGDALYLQADMDEGSAVKYVRLVVERTAPEISENELEDLDITGFKDGDLYKFNNLEWGSSPARVEEQTGIKFENPGIGVHDPENGNGIYFRARIVNYFGFKGAETYDFMGGGLREVVIGFGTEDGTLDITELETKLLGELEKMYGKADKELEALGKESDSFRKRRNYIWEGAKQSGIQNCFGIDVYSDKDDKTVQMRLLISNYAIEEIPEPDVTSTSIRITDLKKDDSYTYRGIEWGCTPEELEDLLGIKLREPDDFGEPANIDAQAPVQYSEVRRVEFLGMLGMEYYSFLDNELFEAGIVFDNRGGDNLRNYEDLIIQMLENTYEEGEGKKESEIESGDGKTTIVQYKWNGKAEEGYINSLFVVCYRNKFGTTEKVQLAVCRQPVDKK